MTRHFLALVDSRNDDSTYGTTYQSNPRFTVQMEKGNGTGYTNGRLISFTDMVIHIQGSSYYDIPEESEYPTEWQDL